MTHPHYLLIQSKSKSSSSKPIIVDELEDSDFEDDDKKSRIAAPGDKKRRLKSKQDIEVEKKAKKVTKSAITPSAPATVPVPEPALKAGKEKNITPTLKANDVVDMTENKMTKKDASNNSNSNSSSNSNSQAAKKIMSPSKALKRKEVRISHRLLVVIVLLIIFLDNRCLEVRDHFLVSPRLALKIVLLPILQPSAHHLDLNPHQHQFILPQVVGR